MSDRAKSCCPPATAVHGPVPTGGEDYERELSALAKALGHPARVRILRLLAERSGCVCGDIVNEVGLAQSTVSQHLAVLKDAGLIRGDVDGPRVCYCLANNILRRFKMLAAAL
ncbi:MAG: winged helix-turn-helix transcriptional regulator [Planctomycetes bacterium]|jgi:ArsR family transcriptional regulator|nr:winged helix-turn-helix transcriptional regulator [Planctomycetota bacterium]